MLLPLHLGFGRVELSPCVSGQNVFGFGSLDEDYFVRLSVGSYSQLGIWPKCRLWGWGCGTGGRVLA